MNRKLLTCALIAVAAVAIIVTTVVLRAGNSRAKPSTEQPLAPALTVSTLTEAEIRSAVGDNSFVTSSRFSRLSKDPVRVNPATCIGISMIVPPDSLTGIDWVALRGAVGSSPQGERTHYVAQGMVALGTEDKAKTYLRTATQSWQKCNGQSYTVDASGTVGHWLMKSMKQTDTTLTAAISQENSRYTCQHVLTYQTQYVVDVVACGYDTVDQAQVVANRITSKLSSNLANP